MASPTRSSCSGCRYAKSRQTATASTSAAPSAATVSARLCLVERLDHAFRPHPLPDGEAQLAGYERRRPVECQVVERRPVLTADLKQVTEALGGDERDARPPPL